MGLTQQFVISNADVGRGHVVQALHPSAPLIAVTGSKGRVLILNKLGKVEHQFPMPGVVDMAWECGSDTLAIITGSSSDVHLYTHRTRHTDTIDTKMSDLRFICWSHSQPQFAIGAKSGQFVVYNRRTLRLVPVVGTHTQQLLSGVWTPAPDSRLLIISADRSLSISDAEGSMLKTIPLPSAPQSVCVSGTASSPKRLSLAAVNLGNAVLVVNLRSFSTSVGQFNTGLGLITSLTAGINGEFVVGFKSGAVGLLDLAGSEVRLRSSVSLAKSAVHMVNFGEGSGLVAAAADNRVRLLRINDDGIAATGDEAAFESDKGVPDLLTWSRDGQQLLLGTDQGNVTVFTLKVLNVSASFGTLVFSFISTRTIGVKNLQDNRMVCTVPVNSDPTFISAGMAMLGVGANNQVSYYEYFIPNSLPYPMADPAENVAEASQQAHSGLLRTVDYPSTVTDLKVNSQLAAVVYDGRVQLSPIRDTPQAAAPVYFPQSGDTRLVSIGLSEAFFLYATTNRVSVYALHNLQQVATFTCNTGLKRAFPNPACTRIAYVDESNGLFNLNLVTEVANKAEGFEPDQKTVLWDQAEATVFITHDSQKCVTFVNTPHSRHGATCESVLVKDSTNDNLYTPLPPGYTPITLFLGTVVCQTPNGTLDTVPLQTHTNIFLRTPNAEAFYNNFSLNRLRWSSNNISTPQEAEDLAVKALHMLDVELAIRVYRQLSQPSLVLCLEKIRHIHEKNLLLGHVSMIMGYMKDAQNFFLRSSQPLCALEMRRDMMQWERALTLAAQLAPEEVPVISREYAQQLEYRGVYAKALEMFQQGHRQLPTGQASTELSVTVQEVERHNEQCRQGAARCQIRTGNIADAMKIAKESAEMSFVKECAKLCEDNQKHEEAAQLYEKAGDLERAATIYIERCKNLKAAARLLPLIKSRNIIGIYAHGKEAEGAFAEAEKAYLQAEDWDNAVRLRLEKLNDLHGAYIIVRQTRSANAAALVAKKCKLQNEYGMAVEFLVLAKSLDEAFELAKAHDCMFHFESALLNQVQLKDGVAPLANQADFTMIAEYYDNEGKAGQAGMYYHISGNYAKALKKYLESGQPEDIEKAVEVVGKAHSDSLTNKFIDYLMGETDGEPKDPSYIFKLYLAMGSYEKAAKTSVIIAAKEQEMGNYKSAHKTLVEAYSILQQKNMRVPNDLRRALMLLHSYIIVKDLLKIMKNEDTACRMLLRVSRNIQKFPKHIATIVTTTVLQCIKSNFKKSAFEYACFLIQNEKYRTEMTEKSRKKVEGIVRRHSKDDAVDPVEPMLPCPYCDAPVAETELDCGACKNTIPFCIVTGKHIVKNDYTATPCCGFPATYSALMTRLSETLTCPICGTTIDISKVNREAEPELKALL
ncbi:wd repeat-containing protein 19 [Leishmania donovani]|uniref:Wd repeat-containing protein 19 n=1 Tax=Leishmania donovani TaxID=5661 RepID=A0A3Q8IC66_LEIDO|nr:wd repeat-containing protein 19 [Leishmania donovani]